ncbi:MAG: hypothetical protein ABIJ31_02060 [Pseudomonadota bacterium]
MKKNCTQYTSEQISQFIDKALPDTLFMTIDAHQKNCTDCRDLIKKYQAMSDLFSSHADHQVDKIDTHRLKKNLEPVFGQSHEKYPGLSGKLFGKNIYLKLASIVAIVVISMVVFQGRLSEPTGPSAIVKSINTDFSSVMIIETQQHHHTIIWFSET